jgi:8-oxo-dGTP diphosphatase
MSSCAAALEQPRPEPVGLPLVLVAAAALIDVDGRVLITEHTKKDPFQGMWEFPGGKMEPGETPEFTLMRELEEELGIETRPTCYYPLAFASYTYHEFGKHMLMPLFVCRTWRGEPQGREGQQLKWVPPKQLYNYTLVPADVPLIAQLIDRV